jgi:2,4-diketo-3-deoxy-L-fuconate hydrolase
VALTALACHRGRNGPETVVVVDGRLYPLAALAEAAKSKLPPQWAQGGIPALLLDWDKACAWLEPILAGARDHSAGMTPVGEGTSTLMAPYRPERIFCAASNYVEHANEMGTVLASKAESKPYMFLKLRNTVIGPNETVRMPPETKQLDWEVELAAVIGRRCRRVSVERALDVVAGYAIVNDISARDLNVRGDYPFKFDWFQGKCHDTFAPFGPWIVPASQIPDPQAVHLRLDVNGVPMQEDSTANMIWTVREQIAYLSTIVTLEPGDVIATGTPTGVGMGRGIFLKDGDRLRATVAGIGSLDNDVRAETTAA